MVSAMGRVSVRNLLAHKVRLALTVISVVLGTAFIAGSFVFTDTLNHTFTTIFGNAYQGIATHVEPDHGYDPGVPFSVVSKIEAIDGVDNVVPSASTPAVVVNAAGKKLASGGAPSSADIWYPPSQTIGAKTRFAAGLAPERSGEMVLNSDAAKIGHIKVGDQVRLVLPNKPITTLTVTGIYTTASQTGGYVGALLYRSQALSLLTDGKYYDSIDVSAKSGVSQRALTARISKVLPAGTRAITGKQLVDDTNKTISKALSFVNYVLLAFGFIALVVGTFIIYNTFSMIIAQRLRELALLRAVGASRGQVLRSVLLEAIIIGTIGALTGIAGGIGLAYGLRALLKALNVGLPTGALVLEARTVIVALLVGIGITLLSALAPARRAATIAPVAAMREEFSTPTAASIRRRTILGTALAAVGVLVTALGASSSSARDGGSLLALGLLLVGAAALLLSPFLSGLVINPLGRLIGKPFGQVGTLARTNALRNPRRTAATAFALTLGLMIVSGISVLGASAKASINKQFDTGVAADIVMTTQSSVQVPLAAAQAAKRVDGVRSVTELHTMPALVDGTIGFGYGVDGPLPGAVKLAYTRGHATPSGLTMLAGDTTAKSKHWTVGSTHTLSLPGQGSVTVSIGAIYKQTQLLGPWLVSGTVYRRLIPVSEWSDAVALVRVSPGQDVTTVRDRVDSATNAFYVVRVDTREQFKGQVADRVNGLLGLVYGLLGLAIVIAILGIVNTLALSVVERRREIGMLRAVGMVRGQVRRTIYLESLLIAVFGALLGLVLGVVFGALFTRLLKSDGLDVLQIPWAQSVAFLVLAAIVGVLAALWPGVRAARTPPLAAIGEG